jgi:hypothetical protein
MRSVTFCMGSVASFCRRSVTALGSYLIRWHNIEIIEVIDQVAHCPTGSRDSARASSAGEETMNAITEKAGANNIP